MFIKDEYTIITRKDRNQQKRAVDREKQHHYNFS